MVPPPFRSLDKNCGPQGQACRAAIPALWPTKRSGAWRSASFLEAPAQVPGQEPLGRGVELDPVLRLGEAVPLVREEHVLVIDAGVLQRRHDLLGLGLLDPGVVR